MEVPLIIKVFTRSSEVSDDNREVLGNVYKEHEMSSELINSEQEDREMDSKSQMPYCCLRNRNKRHQCYSVEQNMDSVTVVPNQNNCNSGESKFPVGHKSEISTFSNIKNSLKRKRAYEVPVNENEGYDEVALRSEMKKINAGTFAKFSQYYMNLDDQSKEIYKNKLACAQCLDPYTLDSKGLRRRNTIIPQISKQEIFDYLSKSDPSFACDVFEDYQKTDAYLLARNSSVVDISAKKLHEGKCLIKAIIRVEDGKSISYLPWLIVDEKGSPKFSHCNCSTGLVEVCCHITALMFSLEGVTQLEQHISHGKRENSDKEDVEEAERDVEIKPIIRRIIRRRHAHSCQKGDFEKRNNIALNGADPWEKEFEDFHVVACTTLEEVQDIIKKHEEETWTKFVRDYKDPRFGSSDWTPDLSKCRVFWFKNVDKRLTAVPILSEGIPFVHVGRLILNCHQGRDAWKKKKEKHKKWKSSLTPNEQAVRKLKKNNIDSKKIGCPAGVYVTQVARFPDYSIQKLRKKRTRIVPAAKQSMDTLTYSKLIMGHRLKKAFMCNPRLLRMEIRYYIRLPKLSSHQGHPMPTQLPSRNNNEEPPAMTEGEKYEESPWPKDVVARTREPVDPRVRDYIAQLTRQGVKSVKSVRELIIDFVRDVLFKEEEPPPINRRRYFPAEHDIRNVIYKTKLEMKKEAKQDLQQRCSALVQDISHLVASKDDESYLQQLEEQLKLMYNSIQSNMPIELVSFRPEDIQETHGETLKKEHRNEQEVERATYHLEQQMILQQDSCNSTQLVKQDPTPLQHEPSSNDEIAQGSSDSTYIVHQEPSSTSHDVQQNTQVVQSESKSTQIVGQEESHQNNNIPIVEGSGTSVTEVYYYNPAGYYEQVVGSTGVVANQEYSISEVVYETQI